MVTVTKVYGADWCGDCVRAQAFFTKHGVEYEKIDVVKNPEAWADAEKISGRKNIPVVVFSDDSYLVEPTDADLADKLGLSA